MDRQLPSSALLRRRLRRAAIAAGLVAALALLFVGLPAWLRPSVDRDRIRTGRVEAGPLEAVVEATGTLVPAAEAAISSPLASRVERVVHRVGDRVAAGEPIVELDAGAARVELARLDERVARARRDEEQRRLELARTLADLEGRAESARLDLEIATFRRDQQARLHAEGLASEEALRAAEVAVKKGDLELAGVHRARDAERRLGESAVAGLALETRTLEQERKEAALRLDRATARADRAGVVTWVVAVEGSSVERGEVLARVADLSAFEVEAAVSDVHAGRLAVGQSARVVIADETLDGTVTAIDPTVANGQVRFRIALVEPAHPALRNNLRVDVAVVTERRPRALSVPRGPWADGGGRVTAFVIEGDRAVRREAELGLAARDAWEVVAGLAEGDEVILSDTREWRHLDELKLD